MRWARVNYGLYESSGLGGWVDQAGGCCCWIWVFEGLGEGGGVRWCGLAWMLTLSGRRWLVPDHGQLPGTRLSSQVRGQNDSAHAPARARTWPHPSHRYHATWWHIRIQPGVRGEGWGEMDKHWNKHCNNLEFTQKIRVVESILVECWPTVHDAGPALTQHWLSVSS